MAGGSKCPPPIFIFENNRKSNKIMQCVDFFLVAMKKGPFFTIFREFIYRSVKGT